MHNPCFSPLLPGPQAFLGGHTLPENGYVDLGLNLPDSLEWTIAESLLPTQIVLKVAKRVLPLPAVQSVARMTMNGERLELAHVVAPAQGCLGVELIFTGTGYALKGGAFFNLSGFHLSCTEGQVVFGHLFQVERRALLEESWRRREDGEDIRLWPQLAEGPLVLLYPWGGIDEGNPEKSVQYFYRLTEAYPARTETRGVWGEPETSWGHALRSGNMRIDVHQPFKKSYRSVSYHRVDASLFDVVCVSDT